MASDIRLSRIPGAFFLIIGTSVSAQIGDNDADTGGDAGNTFELATAIEVNTPYRGYDSNCSEDEDWYQFYVLAHQTVTLRAQYSEGASIAAELYSPTNEQVASGSGEARVEDAEEGMWRARINAFDGCYGTAGPFSVEYQFQVDAGSDGGGGGGGGLLSYVASLVLGFLAAGRWAIGRTTTRSTGRRRAAAVPSFASLTRRR